VSEADRALLPATIVVPVYNGAETLGGCLEALATQTVDANDYEVIVVDDGSTDASARIAARLGAQVILQEHAGAAAARNRGAEQALGQILLFTDADCEPLPDWIETMTAPFSDPVVAGVKGVYCTRQRSLVARFGQAEYEEKYARLSRMSQIDFVDTYSAAYRRRVFEQEKGFDTAFPAATVEDQELSYRLARAGHKLVFASSARVYHLHPETVWRYAYRKAYIARWKVLVHAWHPSKAVRDSYTPWTQKAQLVLLPLVVGLATVAAMGLVSWLFAALVAGLGLLSTIPLMSKARQFGWSCVLATPVLVLVRTLALNIGLVWGLVSQLGRGHLLNAQRSTSV
jgi:cellulose synthase/poly-beta-1,6-N-acetylglucosamine synthase-like glycosyltransferase